MQILYDPKTRKKEWRLSVETSWSSSQIIFPYEESCSCPIMSHAQDRQYSVEREPDIGDMEPLSPWDPMYS